MSTVFFDEMVNVTITRGEDGVASVGSDIRNTLLVTSHNKFSEAYRIYRNLSEILLDGFKTSDFVYQFARIYFSSFADPYDKPALLVTGGLVLGNADDYITKIKNALGKTNNFGFIVTDIRYRGVISLSEEYDFIYNIATYVETTDKFYAVWLDAGYIPSTITWILNSSENVVLTENNKGLVTESSTEDFNEEG